MLSTEDPSDPSCSSKASDLVAGHEAPNFSIRDYVFKSRIKAVGINWPFPEQLLQLCLDNGIRDVLPPFEPLSLVRAHCFRKETESGQLFKCSKDKLISGNGKPEKDIELVVSSDQSQRSLPEEKKEFKVRQEDISDNELIPSKSDINASSVTSRDLIQGISDKQSEKKCRLAVSVRHHTDTSKPEELVSTLTTAAEPMASKICPVCKSFTSSSNTTLNAHIDQCLSSDQSNATVDVTECSKSKAKPRKKRLMGDIYTTAPHCTLEELDRRNGTNWATDLSLVAPMNDANVETKRTKTSLSDTVNRGNVGDIYVDSNGTKLLILSKFNDLPPTMSMKKFKLKKNGKESCLIAKRNKLKPKCSKFMIDNPQNKKLRGIKGYKNEFERASEGDNIAEVHKEKEESLSQLLSAQYQVKNSKRTPLGHWVCSKRSDLARKHDAEDISKGSEKMTVVTNKLSVRLMQPDLDKSSIERSCDLNFSRSSKAMASSPKVKKVDMLSNTKNDMDCLKKSSPQSSKLNSQLLWEGDSLTAACMTKVSSPNDERHHPSLRARKCSTSKKSIFTERTSVSLEAREAVKSVKLISPKKFQKHVSISGCSQWLGGEKYSDVNGGCHGSTEGFGLISSRANEVNKDHQSNFSENQENRCSGMTDPMKSTVIVAPASDDNLDLNPEEHEESISRNESQLESPSQRPAYDREVQDCGVAISNEIISPDSQLAYEPELIANGEDVQTDNASIQEPHPCFTSHVEMDIESNQENSSTISVRVKSNQDHNMVADMDTGSPVSIVSAICSPSLEDSRHRKTDQSVEIAAVQDKLNSRMVRKNNKVKFYPPAREPCCSCSQSLSRESHLTNHIGNKMASNLFIKTSSLSSFQPCPSLESPTRSVVTMPSSKSSINISSPCSQSRIQAASNPILRLMGKDLVVNKEGPVQLPEILPFDSDYSSRAKFINFGLPNHGGLSYNSYHGYTVQSTATHQIQQHPLPHLRRSDKLDSSSQCGIDRMVASPQNQSKPSESSYLARQVILIHNDSHEPGSEPRRNITSVPQPIPSSNLMASHRFLTCFPSQYPYASRTVNFHQSANSEGSFMFPSPSSLYFSPPTQQ